MTTIYFIRHAEADNTNDFGALKAYKFVVIYTRYKNKWLYRRAKERDNFETPGGRIESGETPLEAAKRELHELGDIPPDYEMAEVKLFDTIPDKMRFPQILPVLYNKIQALYGEEFIDFIK